MKKNLLLILIVALFSCGSGQSGDSLASSSSTSEETVLHATFEVTLMRHDGNRDDPDQVFYYCGMSFFPAFLRDWIDTSSLVVGDAITLAYTGECRYLDTYPGYIRIEFGHLVSAEISGKASVVEAAVSAGDLVAPEGVSLEGMSDGYREGTAIDGDYRRTGLDGLEKAYLSCSALDKGKARAAYAFDPTKSSKAPNIAWEDRVNL